MTKVCVMQVNLSFKGASLLNIVKEHGGTDEHH